MIVGTCQTSELDIVWLTGDYTLKCSEHVAVALRALGYRGGWRHQGVLTSPNAKVTTFA